MTSNKLRRFSPLPSIADFLFVAIFLLISLHRGKDLLKDGDTGYHIRAGEYILRTMSVPTHDMFSYLSPPLPWTAHEWLSEVIMALVHSAFGLTGIVIFFAFLIALTIQLLFETVHAGEGNILVSLGVVILATAASGLHWLARPHVFSFVLMVVWYHILCLYQYKSRNLLYTLPFIMVLWANLHGGFMGGFILLFVFLAGNAFDALFSDGDRKHALKKLKVLALTASLCVAGSILNPYGYHLLLFPIKLTSSKYLIDGVCEFMSPNFHEMYVRGFEIYLLVFVAALAWAKKKLQAQDVLSIVLFLHMSLYSARYIPLFAIVAARILAQKLSESIEEKDNAFTRFLKVRSRNISRLDASAVRYLWPVASILLVVYALAAGRIAYGFDPKIEPVAATEFIKRESIAGNMFNSDEFGDYLVYAAAPAYKVFIDGRLDMYGVDHLKEYHKVTEFKQGWEDVLEKYRITWIFFPADAPLARYLLLHKDWKLIYADKVTNIFVKNIPQYRYLIERYPAVKPAVVDNNEAED
ncbi:hypothetical protein [Geomonas edaphica]|uniref:hypothetical protein n=1 Tax=Geomonas edaphica TaxID=2570226 RepID=UPI0010A88FBB|nr:hypothetical protein [Geomonas edaphica]